MDRIVIFGSGKHANVIAYNLNAQGLYHIAGYVTTDSFCSDIVPGRRIFSGYKNFDEEMTFQVAQMFKTNYFAIGFGSMEYRKKLYMFLVSQGWKAPQIIHPSAIVSPDARIGDGVLIEAGCIVTPNPLIGDNVVVNTGSQVNHDNIIEDHVYIASGVVTSGSIRIGNNSLIDDGVIVTLERTIGSNCIIGAGSVVTRDIPDNVIAYGNPCKIIRDNRIT